MPGTRTSKATPKEILAKAKLLAKKHRKTVLLQGSKLKKELLETELSDMLGLGLPGKDYTARTVWLAAFLLLLAEEGKGTETRCAKELAALDEIRNQIQAIKDEIYNVEARIAAEEMELQAAQSAETLAEKLRDEWSKLVQDLCGGLGIFDPLCYVAAMLESIYNSSLSDSSVELQVAQDTLSKDQYALTQLQSQLAVADKELSADLSAYTKCMMQQVYPDLFRSALVGTASAGGRVVKLRRD